MHTMLVSGTSSALSSLLQVKDTNRSTTSSTSKMDVVHTLPSMEEVFSENLQDNGSFMGAFLFLLL